MWKGKKINKIKEMRYKRLAPAKWDEIRLQIFWRDEGIIDDQHYDEKKYKKLFTEWTLLKNGKNPDTVTHYRKELAKDLDNNW
jgi:hypothetical protein